ncbi:hypothetical protein KI387_041615, partial [Taxus chinensis]
LWGCDNEPPPFPQDRRYDGRVPPPATHLLIQIGAAERPADDGVDDAVYGAF